MQTENQQQPPVKPKQCPVCLKFFMSVPQKDHHVSIRHGGR